MRFLDVLKLADSNGFYYIIGLEISINGGNIQDRPLLKIGSLTVMQLSQDNYFLVIKLTAII
ncbi:hypothetical protein BF17_02845 [Yersinia similis]|uniref:Uncharacterized protein n=1 Tax=Yersinia similis TaxID=367190 RepID=A0ABN4CXM0_9GAMM|nr:hypothetical protein BF17_02845 [Yersinia similis]